MSSLSLLSSPPVLSELQQADIITAEESDPSELIEVLSGKSPEKQTKVADVLRRHGFEEASKLIAGMQKRVLSHVPVVCFTVELGCKSTSSQSIIIVHWKEVPYLFRAPY